MMDYTYALCQILIMNVIKSEEMANKVCSVLGRYGKCTGNKFFSMKTRRLEMMFLFLL
jgi:hypothetical protein